MSKQKDKCRVVIDNQEFEVDSGQTILEAARQNNFYIPTLCAHKDLSPYGGCRMCIVEVEKMRGFPTSCTTPIEDGMIIRTHTAQIEEERLEILRLLLSEHTSSCLICDESEECRSYMGTIRKVGVTTGCRYCPKDGQCELQEVVEKMGVKDITHPIYYRNFRVEKEDPFYDRDYNLCILCGRCVRVCQEVRLANTLAFKQRGRYTTIGPAFDRTHFEAGCEFCGACVEVCPTGTLSEKARKWEGKADSEVMSTCTYCGVGCQVKLQIKNNQVIGALPADDTVINNGQLCVKGRFCINEMLNKHHRLKSPYKKKDGTDIDILWEEAIDIAADKISKCKTGQFGMIISSNCTNEDLYIAQKFTRLATHSNNIDTMDRIYYGASFNSYIQLMEKSQPLSDLKNSSVILNLGLDARFGRSVVGVEIRRAAKRGSKIITLHPDEHNLSVLSDYWLQPQHGKEREYIKTLRELVESPKQNQQSNSNNKDLEDVANLLKKAKKISILIGSAFIHQSDGPKILNEINRLANITDAGILALPAQNNLAGTLLMGTYPELLPGALSGEENITAKKLNKLWGSDISAESSDWDSNKLLAGKKRKVLFLIGETPTKLRPNCDFLINQNIYPSEDAYDADLMLPSAAFTESDGTFINGEGRIQKVNKAVDPPGKALPDWQILCMIAKKMELSGFDFKNAADIRKEISQLIPSFHKDIINKRHPISVKQNIKMKTIKQKEKPNTKNNGKFSFLLETKFIEHSYRGYPLAKWVDGAEKLFPVETLIMNPVDAGKIGIADNQNVQITGEQYDKTLPVCIRNEQTQGILKINIPFDEAKMANPARVKVRKIDV